MGERRRASERLFESLERLFPFDFRRQYGREMELTFRQEVRDAEREGGRLGTLTAWGRALVGILGTAPREHLDELRQDAGYALRVMAKNPKFTSVAVLTLALGIGANTAIFSVINCVLLSPLPYANGDRIVVVRQQAPLAGVDQLAFSPPEIAEYAEQSSTLSDLVEHHTMIFTLYGRSEPQRVDTGVVSANFFEALGVAPLLGRTFLPTDDSPDADPVLVLSYRYWQSGFAGDEGVIGQTVEMNDRVHTIIGVLPTIPEYPGEDDVYMPTSACPSRSGVRNAHDRNWRNMTLFGRLKPKATLTEAQADMRAIAGRLKAEHPEAYPATPDFGATAIPLKEELTRAARPTLILLAAASGFVLLIVCANMASLILSRLVGRQREMAVRAALGAGRGRLVRQVMTENTIHCLAGGLIGVALASAGLRFLVALAARHTTRAAEIRIDTPVLLFTLVLCMGTGLLLGSIPAMWGRAEPLAALKDGGDAAGKGPGRQRARRALVVSQVAVSFLLLIGAVMMLRSLWNISRVNPGFNPDSVLTLRLYAVGSQYGESGLNQYFEEYLRRVEALPGVTAAGAGITFPLYERGVRDQEIRIEGRETGSGQPNPRPDLRVASPGYFRALAIQLVRGRLIGPEDRARSPQVALVNASMARHHWGEQDPIGRRFSIPDRDGDSWWTIVGVVGDVRQYGLDREVKDEIYLPFAQRPQYAASILMRTASDPAALALSATREAHAIDPRVVVTDVRTLDQVRSASMASPRLTAILLLMFGALALCVTAAGIFGVLALSVSQRTREMGVRMALGATPAQVLAMVMREGMALVLAGLAAGAGVAFIAARLMSGLVFGVEPTDPFTFGIAAALMLVAAAAACFPPARRATSIDPMVALRSE